MDQLISANAPITTRRLIDWGIAQVALAGQTVSGDRHLVRPCRDGLLLAVVDGLGHGEEAARAAEIAVSILGKHIRESVFELIGRCHEALKGTRGAAVSLARFHDAFGTMTWLGVGNVEGVLLRADGKSVPAQENIRLFQGVAGYRLPPLSADVTPMKKGDLVILFTDGIRRDFLSEPIPRQSPKLIASRICEKHSKGNDDALVLVARYAGVRH
jgi:hypothetical protein